jgi:double-strand break repair protein MRE11
MHDFVNKDDKMEFYSCLQWNLEETRVYISQVFSSKLQIVIKKLQNKLSSEADKSKIEEEGIIVNISECMQVFKQSVVVL